ncbi:porin [Noviherbaspirillum saxi]|uniref:Porin n=2 Tax=Noviherbaspirillum saxi TaxID=2320863 RepID=A0A3A3G4I7_9BURK|nr:porin [Noviherbaspirillum saxi]
MAAAQTSVSIYGVADMGIVRQDNGGPAGAVWRLDSGMHSGSRIGFRGVEDLGGGLSALFVLENGHNLDAGTAAQGGLLFGRQAWVGLGSAVGTVKFGRQITPIHNALGVIDPMATGLAGDISRIINSYGVRMNNTVNYTLPKLAGISGELAYGLGEVAGDSSASRQIGLALNYTNGPVVAQFAFHEAENPTGTDSARTTLLGGVYNFTVARLHAAYAVNRGLGTLDTRDAMIGASVPFGAHSFMVSYIHKEDKARADADADQINLAYTYALSKRTNLYTSYSRTSNDSVVSYLAARPGATDKVINAGIRHRF